MLLPANKRRSEQVPMVASPEKIPKVASPTGGSRMGFVYADIELVSTEDIALHRRGFLSEDQIKRMRIKAMVDSGSYMLVITDEIRRHLDLPLIHEQVFRLSDDSEITGEVVGPVEVHFENRSTTTRAVVLPGAQETLLGSIPLEDLDVVIDPKQQRLMVNPRSPDVATKYAK